LAILLVHHRAPSWSRTNIRKLKLKMGISGVAEVDAEALAERSYDKATLFLVKSEFAQGDVVVSSRGETYNEAHNVFTSAERKPNVVLNVGRCLPLPHSHRLISGSLPKQDTNIQNQKSSSPYQRLHQPLISTLWRAEHHRVQKPQSR